MAISFNSKPTVDSLSRAHQNYLNRGNITPPPTNSVKGTLFHHPSVSETQPDLDRASYDLVNLGLVTQKDLEHMQPNLLTAIQTLHIDRALGLSVDEAGNTVHDEFVDGEKSITMDDLKELTPNELEHITHECQTAQEVFQFINPIRENRVNIGEFQIRNSSDPEKNMPQVRTSRQLTWQRA